MPLYDLPTLDPLADFRRQMQALRQPLAHAQVSIADQLPGITPQEQESLLAELAGSVGSGLSYAAETLDKPGSALRGLISGEPSSLLRLIPFSDTLGITDPQDVISGREMLTRWGLTEPNNPDEWELADFLGFGAELIDPLLPLGLGKGALTASGKAARAAGLLDDATKLAGKGPRVGRMTTTLQDLAQQSPEALEAVQRAAGPQAADLLASTEPLGGVASYFGKPFYGPTAQKVGGVLDTLGEGIRMSKPVRYLASAFENSLHQTLTPEVQRAAQGYTEATGRGHSTMDEFLAQQMTKRLDAGLTSPQAGQAMRMALEQVDPADVAILKALKPDLPDHLIPDPVVQGFAKDARVLLDSLLPDAEEWGVPIPVHKDDRIGYGPRQMTAGKRGKGGSRGSREITGEDAHRTGRIRPLTNIGAGTEAVRTIASDPHLEAMIASGAKPKDIAQWIDQKYGQLVPPTMTNKKGKVVDQRRALARYLSSLPSEARKEGLFGNDVFFDFRSRMWSWVDSVQASKTAFKVVTDKNVIDPTGVPITKVMRQMKIVPGTDQKGFLAKVAAELNIPFKSAKKIKIREDVAADLARFKKSFEGPEAVGGFVKIWDAANSLFKMGVLSWPSRHVRDFISGMFNNFIGGELKSPADIVDAWKLLRGGTVANAEQIPAVKAALQARGLTGADNATKVLREIVFAQNLINKYGNIVGDITGAAHPVKGTFEDLAAGLPGSKPISLGEIAKTAIPRSRESLNPLNIRGVGDREESKFFIAKTSEEIGYLTDSMNRLVPFISQLKRGVDPRAAKLKTTAMQVDYTPAAYTPLERQVLTRLIPFYRFTRGQVPWVIKQLWEAPGGKLAQTIRGTDAGRDEQGFVPDYLGHGAAIPLGAEQDGTQRYLSSLGLAHEPVFDLFRPGRDLFDTVSGTLSGLGGNLSPYLKWPIEVGTGKQLFTGRDLDELDSRLGRIVNPNEPINPGILLEETLMNSPLSKLVTTIGTLRDPRKSWGDAALNTLTGARVSNVNMDKAKYFASREALEKLLSADPAVRDYKTLYVKAEELGKLDPTQQRAYAVYKNVQKDSLARARERAKTPLAVP